MAASLTAPDAGRGRLPESSELLTREDNVRLKRCIYSMQRSCLPPITTHNVVNDGEDPVLRSLRRCHLFTDKSDRVKVSRRTRQCYLAVRAGAG